MTRAEWHVLSGWGESHHGFARVFRPRSADEIAALLASAARDGRRLALRGSGRSYGDAALLSRGDVLDLSAMDRIVSFDAAAGTVVCEPGVSIEKLWRTSLPAGLWPTVVPGTMRPTIGGCVAMNIHGKNHFKAGGFGEHVLEIELITPAGDRLTLSRERDGDLFRAAIGGFGLLGVVTSVKLAMHRVACGLLGVEARAVASLASMIEEFERRAGAADYLVGWVDCFDRRGRGVLHQANYLPADAVASPAATFAPAVQDLPPRILGVVPRAAAPAALRPLARPAGMKLLNAMKYRAAFIAGTQRFRQPHVRFAFLLDYIPGWKRIYEPGGLIQYQSFVPKEHALRVHTELLRLCRERGIVAWLGVYKKHRACSFLMSHAVDGFSFAMDFPVTSANRERLWALCREMDEIVLAAGGRFYLAKDLTATPDALRRAYPGLDEFRAIKRRLDPAGVLTSDLAIRLGV